MAHWNKLTSVDDIEEVSRQSQNEICLIFKHSTTCSISGMAHMRLQDHIDEINRPVRLYHLDLLKHRDISAKIADTYSVHHESPQVLLIDKGESFYDASHFDITVKEINETLDWHASKAS